MNTPNPEEIYHVNVSFRASVVVNKERWERLTVEERKEFVEGAYITFEEQKTDLTKGYRRGAFHRLMQTQYQGFLNADIKIQ